VHDGTVRLDRSSDDIVILLEVDDYDFGGGGLVLLLAHTYEGIGFEGLRAISAGCSNKSLMDIEMETYA